MSTIKQSLATYYRPKNFDDIVGQSWIVESLKQSIINQNLPSVCLFSGHTGVGKTTTARVWAKVINCQNLLVNNKNNNINPCENCESCLAIEQNRSLDVIEIDAASRTKVEETRELLEQINYPPINSRFKIYIIDEIHMLSTHSFNALLKSLEEPPEYVKFLLATTDPQKIPPTVLSRCLHFPLKNIPSELIENKLCEILNLDFKEITYEPAGVKKIAIASMGSLRNALTLLQQLLLLNQPLTINNVERFLGLVSQTIVDDLFTALLAQDGQKMVNIIQQFAEQNGDFLSLCDRLLTDLTQIAWHQQLKSKINNNINNINNISENLINLAQHCSPENIQLYYQILLIGKRDLPYAPSLKIGFEMVLLRLLAFQPQPLSISASTNINIAEKPKNMVPSITPTVNKVNKNINNNLINSHQQWLEHVEQLNNLPADQLSILAKTLIRHTTFDRFVSDNSCSTLVLKLDQDCNVFYQEKTRVELEQAMTHHFNTKIKLVIQTTNSNTQDIDQETFASQETRVLAQQQQELRTQIEHHPLIAALINQHGATIQSINKNINKNS